MSLIIKHVGICGADETVMPSDVARLCFDFSHTNTEIGILFSARNEGKKPRYPARAWRDQLVNTGLPRDVMAAHLCGQSMDMFVTKEPTLFDELQHYGRIQLNIPKRILENEEAVAGMRTACDELVGIYPSTKIIYQYTQNSAPVFEVFRDAPYIQVLFDESGGASVAATEYPLPIEGILCGYTGGLRPGNLPERFGFIKKFAGQTPIWIDAEGAFRDPENSALFSLSRARAFLTEAATLARYDRQ